MKVIILLALGILGAQCSSLVHKDVKDILRPENAPKFVGDERVRPALQRGEPSIKTEVYKAPFESFNDAHRDSHLDSNRPPHKFDAAKKSVRTIQRALQAAKPYVNPDEKYNQAPPTEDKDNGKDNGKKIVIDPVPEVPAPGSEINPPEEPVEPVVEDASTELEEPKVEVPAIFGPIGSGGVKPKPGPEGKPKPAPADGIAAPLPLLDGQEPKPKPVFGGPGLDGQRGPEGKPKPAPAAPLPLLDGQEPKPKPVSGGPGLDGQRGPEGKPKPAPADGIAAPLPLLDGPKPKPVSDGPGLDSLRGADEITRKPKPAPNAAPGDTFATPGPKEKPKPAPVRRSLMPFFGLGDAKPKPDPKAKPLPMGGGARPSKPPPKPKPGPGPADAVTQTWRVPPSMGSNGDYMRMRSQMALVSSPHSADYADEAYIAVATAQDMCSSDFASVCSAPLGASDRMFAGRGFAGSASNVDDMEGISVFDMINSLFGSIVNGAGGQDVTITLGVTGDDDDWYDDDAVDDDNTELAMPWNDAMGGGMSRGVMLRPVLMTNNRVLHEHEHEDWEGYGGHHHRGEEHLRKDETEDHASDIYSRYQQTLQGDPLYASYMGFGMAGDQCLMANYEQLSPACQSALDDVVSLREEYIVEEEGCGFHAHLLLLLGLLAALIATCLCIRKKRKLWRARMGKVKTTLAAIHADADLKARVEAASGVPVPPAACCKEKCEEGNGSLGKCRFRKVVAVVLSICVSFLMVRIAAGITMTIANNMVYEEEDGTQVVPNPVVVLLIFIALLAAELLVLFGIKKAADCCMTRRSSSQSPTACSGTQQPQGGGNGGVHRYLPVLPKFAVPQFTTHLPAFMRKTSSRGAYEPLMTEDSSTATELVQTPAQTPTCYYEQASAPHQHMMYVPPPTYVVAQQVPAQSLSSFSMI